MSQICMVRKAAEYAGKQGWKPIEPGDVCWEDMDGNDVIDSYDRYVVGNIFPNITGGFSTAFSYKIGRCMDVLIMH